MPFIPAKIAKNAVSVDSTRVCSASDNAGSSGSTGSTPTPLSSSSEDEDEEEDDEDEEEDDEDDEACGVVQFEAVLRFLSTLVFFDAK